MNYNLADKTELIAARSRVTYLARKGQRVRITKVLEGRSVAQNNYLHLILAAFGVHFGWELAEAKIYYKRKINPDLYIYEKGGEMFLKSSADLSKEDMATSIDRLLEYSKAQGYPLPLATDQEWLLQIENEIERSRYYR